MTTARLTRAALALLVAAPVLASCTDWAGYDIDVASGKVPQLANMRRSVIPDPYAMPRLPAPGTVPSQNPMGEVPAHFTSLQLDSVAPTLRNPYSPADEAVLARGRLQFANNCAICHGPAGAGDGPVVKPITGADGKPHARFPFAPTLVGGTAPGRSDGYIYAVIAAGRGLMPSYGERLTHADRWAIVNYVRALQAQAGATLPAAQPAAAPASTAPAAPATGGATAPAPAQTQPAGAQPAPAPAGTQPR